MEYGDWIESINTTREAFLKGGLKYVPNILGFVGIILLGWALSWVLQAWTVRLVGGLDRLVRSRWNRSEWRSIEIGRSAPRIIGGIVYWAVLIFFIAAATETLGLAVVSNLVNGLGRYLPNVLAAGLIVLAGFIAGNFVRSALVKATAKTDLAYGELLGRTAQVSVLLVTTLIAIDQLGIDVKFLMVMIAILVGACLGGMSLAFGLGARTLVSNLIATHYLTRVYRVGQTIRIGEIEGRILKVTPAAVLLETAQGQVLIPSKEFSEKSSVLLEGGAGR
jgi:small-conductance mechanosensitive channel